MPPAHDWLCLVLTAARMRHTAGIKHITADKPLNFPISSLCLYFCTSKSTRSINGIAFGHCFPLEFAIQYQTIWLICGNLHKCLANVFLRLLIVNQDQRLVIALYYMFSSTSDENNITKEIFFFNIPQQHILYLFAATTSQRSAKDIAQHTLALSWGLGASYLHLILINTDYLRRKF